MCEHDALVSEPAGSALDVVRCASSQCEAGRLRDECEHEAGSSCAVCDELCRCVDFPDVDGDECACVVVASDDASTACADAGSRGRVFKGCWGVQETPPSAICCLRVDDSFLSDLGLCVDA